MRRFWIRWKEIGSGTRPKKTPRVEPPNFIIVSGDVVQGIRHGTPDADDTLQKQYDEAQIFLDDLTSRFVGGDKRRVVIVPGNHDVSDDKFRQSLEAITIVSDAKKALLAELFKPDSPLRWSWKEFALYKINNHALYNARFAAFSDFYNTFYRGQRSYSLDPAEQFDVFDLSDLGIAVAGFSSCHNNDLLNRQGAIHPNCIAKAGQRLRDISLTGKPLRIAVWHHNMEGPPMESDYIDPDIVQNLIDGGFSLGFHGHQHKPQFLDTRFRHGPNRKIMVISAGTLCGGAAFRFGRSYNVVELDIQNRKGRLHLREMQNDNLRLPIWGPRSLPPNPTSYLDFEFESPPEPLTEPNRDTTLLSKVRRLYDEEKYRPAAELLSPLATGDPLARRLLLQVLGKLDDRPGIIATFDPPDGPAETVALMDALWAEGKRQRLAEVLETSAIAESMDPSVIEIRNKYEARLQK